MRHKARAALLATVLTTLVVASGVAAAVGIAVVAEKFGPGLLVLGVVFALIWGFIYGALNE